MKDGYTLYALKMVYGGFGAFVMVNLAKTFLDISWQRTLGDVPAGGHADDDDREAQVQLQPRGLGLRRPLCLHRHHQPLSVHIDAGRRR